MNLILSNPLLDEGGDSGVAENRTADNGVERKTHLSPIEMIELGRNTDCNLEQNELDWLLIKERQLWFNTTLAKLELLKGLMIGHVTYSGMMILLDFWKRKTPSPWSL